MDYSSLLSSVYQEQLGREPDADGAAYYLSQLQSGALTPEELTRQLNTSVEGQNFDTQYITSQYRSLFERNPEQEGYQYWLSTAQQTGMTPEQLTQYIMGGAQNQDISALQQALSSGYYTNLQMPSFEADPYGGRYTSESRYLTDPSEYPNVSYIGDNMYQFMSPITQQPVISKYSPETWAAQTGLDVLSAPQVDAAIQLALRSGVMSQADYESLYNDLAQSQDMNDVYAAFNKPQAQVVVDSLYGFQTGEAKTLAEAQAEAQVRQQYLDQFGYYPSNFAMADVLTRAGVDYPFTYEQMQNMGALYTNDDVVTPDNFRGKLGEILNMSFGGADYMATDPSQGYYSERGFETDFTPLGEAPTFRSGVAGYTENMPTGFDFGVLPFVAPIQSGPQGFQPGTFNPNATGYTQAGAPIFGDSANQGATGSYLNNPVIGYAADGSPIYGTSAPVDNSGGG